MVNLRRSRRVAKVDKRVTMPEHIARNPVCPATDARCRWRVVVPESPDQAEAAELRLAKSSLAETRRSATPWSPSCRSSPARFVMPSVCSSAAGVT